MKIHGNRPDSELVPSGRLQWVFKEVCPDVHPKLILGRHSGVVHEVQSELAAFNWLR
jgi:hypothetical protein